jgi:hypothetical protein
MLHFVNLFGTEVAGEVALMAISEIDHETRPWLRWPGDPEFAA